MNVVPKLGFYGHILLVDNYLIVAWISIGDLSNCRPIKYVQDVVYVSKKTNVSLPVYTTRPLLFFGRHGTVQNVNQQVDNVTTCLPDKKNEAYGVLVVIIMFVCS